MSEHEQRPVEQVIPALAEDLARLGVKATFSYLPTPRDVNASPIDGGTGEYVLTLPRAIGVALEVTCRSLFDRAHDLVLPRFSTGDAAFDDALHVATTTVEATARMLDDAPLRRALVGIVTPGRPTTIDGARVVVRFPARGADPTPRVVSLLEHLLAVP